METRSNTWCPRASTSRLPKGDFVQKGDYIMDGNPAPHDILSIMGVEALADYMIDEVQDVYRLQGVKINDKHIEVIVRQMLQKWEILDSGDTTLLKGEHVDKQEFDAANEKTIARGGRPAQGEPILLGDHQSLAADAFVHLGGVVPGNHPRSDRSFGSGQEGQAGWPERERHRWSSDPRRYRWGNSGRPPHRADRVTTW